MTEPLISIIVPVYRTEKFLPQCIESILAQTYQNLEIILIDDGSPDRSGAICDKYAEQDKRIIVIHKENGGVSSARNAGLKIAKGEYIGFVDSDDYIAPDMYEYLYGLIIRENVDIAMCNLCQERHCKWEVVSQIDQIEKKYSNVQIFDLHLWTYLMNKLFKRSVLNNVWFHENLSFGEDAYFLFQVLQQNDCIVSDKAKYYYRDNLTSATRSFRKNHLEHLKCAQQYLSFAKKHHLWYFYSRIYWAYLECISAWTGWLALEENPDKESVQILQSHCRKNLWGLLKHTGLKFMKKCFLVVACINFNLASWLAKKLYSKEQK